MLVSRTVFLRHTVRQGEIELMCGRQLRLVDRDAEAVAVLALGRHSDRAADDLPAGAEAGAGAGARRGQRQSWPSI